MRKIPWGRKRSPVPIFLPGESHGQRSLLGYSPWGLQELDMTERLSTHTPSNCGRKTGSVTENQVLALKASKQKPCLSFLFTFNWSVSHVGIYDIRRVQRCHSNTCLVEIIIIFFSLLNGTHYYLKFYLCFILTCFFSKFYFILKGI